MKRCVLILILITLLGVGLWWSRSRPSPEVASPDKPLPVAETPLLERGVFEAKPIAQVPSPNTGIVAEVIQDATPVQAGDLLVRLDDEEIRNKIDAELEKLEQEEENLEGELQELDVLNQQYVMVARLEQAELAYAEVQLRNANAPLSDEDERLRQIEIELATLEMEEAEEVLTRQQELVAKSFAPASSLKALVRNVESARIALREKKTQLDLARQPLPKEEILTMESEVKKARDTVERSRRLHEQELKIQQLRIEGIRLRIAHSQERLDQLRDDLEQVRITAPVDGLFLIIQKYSWGARRWEPLGVGTQIYGMNLVGQIVDPNDLHLRVLVHESDRHRVRPGGEATVHLTAFPDLTVPARVASITGIGQDRNDLSPVHQQAPPVNQALFLAILEVELPPDLDVKPGMTARITLSTGEQE